MSGQLDTIQWLKEKPFSTMTIHEQLEVMRDGRPCPPMTRMISYMKDRHREYRRQFRVTNYVYFNWMCASEHMMKLFCWPCLLFGCSSSTVGANPKKNVWMSAGFDNLAGLTNSAKSHELSEVHVANVGKLAEFEMKRLNGMWEVAEDQGVRPEAYIKTEVEDSLEVSYEDTNGNIPKTCEESDTSDPARQAEPPDKKQMFCPPQKLPNRASVNLKASKPETEFDLWTRSVAHQLNNMGLKRALQLQLKMQTLLTEERIDQD